MAGSDVLYEVADDGVATLTFNRPEVLNALRRQTTDDVLAVLEDVRHNDAVRCLLVTVLPHDQLMVEARAMAAKLAAGPPLAQQAERREPRYQGR